MAPGRSVFARATVSRYGPARALHLIVIVAISLALVIIPHASPARAAGVIWYVSQSAGASDANTCNVPSTPCLSVSGAIGKAGAGDTISIAAGTYSDNVTLSQNLTIAGTGARTTILDGGGTSSVITVNSGVTATIQGLTIQNGSGTGGVGGGIQSSGTLTVLQSMIKNNVATGAVDTLGSGGGGIAVSGGTLTLTQSTVSANTTNSFGGGIDIFGGGTATIVNSTIAGNQDTGGGGGSGIITLAGATLNVSSSTIANNSGSTVGGNNIYNYGVATLKSTIVAGGDCRNDSALGHGGMTDAGNNIDDGVNSCGFTAASSRQSSNPLLATTAPVNNSGPTDTIALQAGSPAIATGACSDISNTQVVTDQRGIPRPTVNCDVGAYETLMTFSPGENGAYTWGGTAANPAAITGIAVPGSSVALYGGGTCSGSVLGSANVVGSGAWSIPVSTLSTEGSYSYSAIATYSAGTTTLTSTCSTPLAVNVDRTPATSTITSPPVGTNTAYVNASDWSAGCGSPTVVGICGTATDNGGSGVEAVYVAIEKSDGTFWNGTSFSSSGAWLEASGTTSWSLRIPQPPEGTYTVASAAIDYAGNTPAIFGMSLAGLCSVTGTGGQLAVNGGQLAVNGGLCTISGTSTTGPVSGQLVINGGQLAVNGGQLAVNGGQLALNSGQLALNGGTCTLRDNSGNSAQYALTPSSPGSLSLSSNGGQLVINGGQLVVNGGLLAINGGLFTPGSGGQLALNGGQLALNGGNCTVTDSSGHSGQLALNGGQLAVNGGQLVVNGGQLAVNGGQLAVNGGQMALNGGQLAVNGGAGGNAGNVVIDTTPPYVSSFSVDNQQQSGAANINPSATFHLFFDESVRPSTVNGSTITLTTAGGTAVPVTPTCDPTCLGVSFSGFQPSTTYTVTVSGVQDLAGNALVSTATNLNSFTFTTAAAPTLTDADATDADGDNIPKGWDGTNAPTFTLGTQSTNTAAWGFSPQHKDLCLVENYMAGTAANGTYYDQHITQAANQAIVNAFANSPVTNPDGTLGVHLVIFEGPLYSAGLPSTYTGPYFGGKIPMTDPLDSSSDVEFNWSTGASSTAPSFDAIRTANFVPTGLSQFCHYAVIAHTLGGTGSSGSSRGIGSSDLVIALGGTVKGAGIGTQMEQQGTVMHELGHNLGLHHGGGPGIPDLDLNYKPNYMSVMNYFYQFEGVPGGFTSNGLDYSRGTINTTALPFLDESALTDSLGLGPGAVVSGGVFGTRFFCPGSTTPSVVADASQPINWGCNASGPVTGIHSADINGDGSPSTVPTVPWEQMHDYNDWANLAFAGGDIGMGSVPPPLVTTPVDISGGTGSGGADSAPTIESKSVAAFSWSGFASPISPNSNGTVVNTGKAGRTYPIKFQLKDSSGTYVSTLSAVRSITYSKSTSCSGGTTDAIDYATTSSSGLHYDTTANQFVYNWATPSTAGCYMLNVSLSDGTTYLSLFSLS